MFLSEFCAIRKTMNAAAPAISVALFGVSDLNHWLLTRIRERALLADVELEFARAGLLGGEEPSPVALTQSATSALMPGQLLTSFSVSPARMPLSSFLASTMGPGHTVPRRSSVDIRDQLRARPLRMKKPWLPSGRRSVLAMWLSVNLIHAKRSSGVPGQSESSSSTWPGVMSSIRRFAPISGPGQLKPRRSSVTSAATLVVFVVMRHFLLRHPARRGAGAPS